MTDSEPTTNDPSSDGQGSAASDERVVARLKVCRNMAMEFANAQFPLFLQHLDDRLFDLASNSTNNQEQVYLGEVQKEFTKHREDLLRYFRGSVGEGYIKFKKGTLDTRSDNTESQDSRLSLVENEKLEENIAVSSIALRADSHFAELVWTSSQRYAVLRGGEKIQESSNPSSPIQFCEALKRSLTLIDLGVKSKIHAYKVFDRVFIPKLGAFLEQINDYLIAEGLLPNLQFTPGVDRSPMPSASSLASAEQALASSQRGGFSAASEASANQESGHYQGNLLGAIRELQTRLAGEVAGAGLVGGGVVPPPAIHGGMPSGTGERMVSVYSNQQLVGALQNLQSQALSITSESGEGGHAASALSPQGVAATSSLLTQQLQSDIDHQQLGYTNVSGTLPCLALLHRLSEFLSRSHRH